VGSGPRTGDRGLAVTDGRRNGAMLANRLDDGVLLGQPAPRPGTLSAADNPSISEQSTGFPLPTAII